MKHMTPDIFETCPPLPVPVPAAPSRWRRLRAWWGRRGWDRTGLPEALSRDVVSDQPQARPIRGRADWERML